MIECIHSGLCIPWKGSRCKSKVHASVEDGEGAISEAGCQVK